MAWVQYKCLQIGRLRAEDPEIVKWRAVLPIDVMIFGVFIPFHWVF